MKIKTLQAAISAIFILFILGVQHINGQKTRDEIESKYKWDLNDLFPSEEAWKESKEQLVEKIPQIESFKGTLTQSAGQLLTCLEFNSDLSKQALLLLVYASMHSDEDTKNMKYSGMQKEMLQVFSDFSTKAAFIDPEILTTDWKTIEGFIKEEPKLGQYRMGLFDLFRKQEHSLSEAEERILALTGPMASTASSVYSTYKNAEMINPEVTLSTGEKVVLSSAGFSKYRASENRDDRELVFKVFFENFKKYEATFGEMLSGTINKDIFYAKARKYESALDAALFPQNISTDVYHSLIENVNKNLDAFHRYLKIKKRMLGVDTIKYLDLYAPVVKDINLEYSYEEAQDMVLKALAPLGDEYTSTIKKAFENNWIDVYPTKGKRSGAYSQGSAYDMHPYILLNYNGQYNDVSTLAHELGHTMQSYFSNKFQPYPTSDYPIFVAEVASTFNEELLFAEMLKTIKDKDAKLSLLMSRLDGFKGTLFRQTQFAEFELKTHEAAEKGEALTGEYLSKLYTDIVKRYYGHDKGICYVDDYIEMEWAYIPHFYYNFYVYQYSTSFTASVSLAEKVLKGEKGMVDNYLKFLSSGSSDYPIELLKKAGVDMTSSEPFDKTIEAMNAIMDEIEKLLDEK